MPSSSDRSSRATLLCFLAPLVAYSITAARTVQGGDTAEFGTITFLGGVTHPPGYPLYTLIARLFAHLPVGPLFWRASMASALCGATACAGLFRLLLKLTDDLPAASVTALVFALSPIEWRFSGVPEVFSLHALACASLLLASIWLTEATDPIAIRKQSFVLGLIAGLGMANHQTLVLLAPVPIWAVVTAWRKLPGSRIATAFGLASLGVMVGLLPYLLLPIFARTAPVGALAWGRTDTLNGFFRHILRSEYGTFTLSPNAENAAPMRQVLLLFDTLTSGYIYMLAAVGVVGALIALRRRRGFAIALGIAFVLCVAFITRINFPDTRVTNDVAARFHLMPLLLFGIPVAFGVSWMRMHVGGGVFILIAVAALIASVVVSFPQADWARDQTIERYYSAAIEPLEKNAAMFVSGDGAEAAAVFVAHIEGKRPDVRFIDLPVFPAPWYRAHKQMEFPDASLDIRSHLAAALVRRVPLYATQETMPDLLRGGGVDGEHAGFLNHLVPVGAPEPPLADAEAKLRHAAAIYGKPADAVDGWSESVQGDVARRWQGLAEEYRRAGNDAKYLALGNEALEFFPRRWIESAEAPQ